MATFPTTPRPTQVSIKSLNQVYSSTFANFNVEHKSNGAQRWEITLDFPTLNSVNGKSLFAFIMAHRGPTTSFDFALPSPLNNTTGTHVGTFNVNLGSASTGSSLTVGGFALSATGLLKAGDFVQFSNHEKVYMITADVASDVSGNGTLNIMPPLHVDVVPGTTTAQCNNVIMTARFKDKTPEVTLDQNVYYNVRGLKLVEASNVPVAVV